MTWLLAESLRILVVASLVAATTATVWVKVQLSEAARSIETARVRAEALREERSKLQAVVDLALRPGKIRARAEGELSMTYPMPAAVRDLLVEVPAYRGER